MKALLVVFSLTLLILIGVGIILSDDHGLAAHDDPHLNTTNRANPIYQGNQPILSVIALPFPIDHEQNPKEPTTAAQMHREIAELTRQNSSLIKQIKQKSGQSR